MKNQGTIYIGRINSQNVLHQQDRVYDWNGSSPSICAGETLGRYLTKIEISMEEKNKIELPQELRGKKFRIRKLTPRECFRLMGVSEKDIDTIQSSGISNSSQYKLAGNSICAGGNYIDSNGNVDGVLYNIFRKMFIDTSIEEQQLTLF